MSIQSVSEEQQRLSQRLTTLKGLPDVEASTQPIDTDVETYYAEEIAGGSGPNGTYLLTDFFGSTAGIPFTENFTSTVATLNSNSSALTELDTVYGRMAAVASDTYGTPPTITIPSGPGAGSYTTYDDAISALIVAADSAVGNTIALLGTANVAALNTSWQAMATNSANEPVNLAKAGVDYSTYQHSQIIISAFIPTLGDIGKETQQGMGAQMFESIANVENKYGQAVVGALREGRNTAGLDAINVGIDNSIPAGPNTLPPQAELSNGTYTVAEARARVLGTT